MDEKAISKTNAVFLVCVVLGFAFCVVGAIYALVLNGILANGSNYSVVGFGDTAAAVRKYVFYTQMFMCIGVAILAIGCAIKLYPLVKKAGK